MYYKLKIERNQYRKTIDRDTERKTDKLFKTAVCKNANLTGLFICGNTVPAILSNYIKKRLFCSIFKNLRPLFKLNFCRKIILENCPFQMEAKVHRGICD